MMHRQIIELNDCSLRFERAVANADLLVRMFASQCLYQNSEDKREGLIAFSHERGSIFIKILIMQK